MYTAKRPSTSLSPVASSSRERRLKFRQWFRPVAPMIAEEALEEVFGRPAAGPRVQSLFRQISSAHASSASRVQTNPIGTDRPGQVNVHEHGPEGPPRGVGEFLFVSWEQKLT